jgi:sterol desaturase/sphingolipid hydroxylase (fatty acid hydroxylase superfamily)
MKTMITFVVALLVALVFRPNVVIGVVVLFAVFAPLEKLFALRRQKIFRAGLLTDLCHFFVNNLFVVAGAIVFIVMGALPFLWIRRFDIEGALPSNVSIALAITLVFVGAYWGHRLTHTVPLLWRFHAVHHSIEQMDWVASARLHPIDAAFTHAFTLLPLVLLGYRGRAVAGATLAVTLLALFQHANVRLRFPVVRWIVNTPEWHHWHHATDPHVQNKNFGLPVVDVIFGTAYMPRDRRATSFGTADPVPPTGYLRHLAYPLIAGRDSSSV